MRPTSQRLGGLLLATMLLGVGCRDSSGGDPARSHDGTLTPGRPGVTQRAAPRGLATRPQADPSSLPPAADGPDDGADPGEEEEGADEGLDCAPPDSDLKPLQLLRFTFAPGVKDKDPVSKLHVARPGQRVWAHLRLRNRSGRDRCVHVVFRVGGRARTELDLKVGESWNWRTWAYATLRSTDRSGQLEFEATDDQGHLLVRERLPIVPEPQ